ncbi:MAG: ammonium transporter AmtB-like domain-containing protein, partial [Olpidium bornovanus]
MATAGSAALLSELQRNVTELQTLVAALRAATPHAESVYAPGDVAWVLTSAALVFIMIPGVGYLLSDGPSVGTPRIPDLVFCIFQGMFAAITPALSLGSTAERGRLLPMLVYIFLWSTVVYNVIAYWTWNPQGWSFRMGGLDFAGGTPVHISSGAAAVAYALILGERRQHPEINKPHSMSHMANFSVQSNIYELKSVYALVPSTSPGGSALAADARAAMAVLVTNIAASVAGMTWMVLDYRHGKKLSAAGFCTGAIAGLVCITPASGYVGPFSAVAFGLIGAVICNFAITLKKIGRYDDSLDVFAVHGGKEKKKE